MDTTVETRELLYDAYMGGRKGRMLSHAVLLNQLGMVIDVLCRRANVDSVAARTAGNPNSQPTCVHCRRKMARLARASNSHEQLPS